MTPGMDLPARLIASLPEAFQESRLGRFGPEDVRAVIAPVQDVIDPGFGLRSERARHRGQSDRESSPINHKLQSLL